MTTFQSNLVWSLWEELTATIQPSGIRGVMDFPRTSKQLVEPGFGHHSFGAAIIFSTGPESRLDGWPPFSPCAAAVTLSSGIATNCTFSGLTFFPLTPALT